MNTSSQLKSSFGKKNGEKNKFVTSIDSLCFGDLLYCNTNKNSRKVSHVVMYISGGKIAHSSYPNGVNIDDLHNHKGYHYIYAVRPTPYFNPAFTGNIKKQSNYEYYDFLLKRKVKEVDLKDKTKKELMIMKNWIYARHGYVFNTSFLKNYFKSKPWYNPNPQDNIRNLSHIEFKNISFIASYIERNF